MTDPNPDRPGPAADLDRVLASLTGPVATLAGVIVETIGGAVKVMLDQSYRAGRAAGRADAEHRVARAVGTAAGDGQVWARCGPCGGDGIVAADVLLPTHQPVRPVDLHETAIIPRIGSAGDTTILPRHDDGAFRSTNEQRRRG